MEKAVLYLSVWSVVLLACGAQKDAYKMLTRLMPEYPLPDLPYAYDALEPHIDEATLRVHHQGHHKAYATKMNQAMREWSEMMPEFVLANSPPTRVLRYVGAVPHTLRPTILNNGGGYFNHILYFCTLCPNKGTKPTRPKGQLLADIESKFGNFSAFQDQFSRTAASLFGSGYVWLAEDESSGELEITTTSNQETLLPRGLNPLLPLDLWEHAYYLKHQNKRSQYVESWWKVVCWPQVNAIREFWRSYDVHVVPDRHSEL